MQKKKIKKSPFDGLEEPIKSLYQSVADYVVLNKGNVVVIGGVGILQEKPGQFMVCIKCLGKEPTFTVREH